jgi:hypothetical protein
MNKLKLAVALTLMVSGGLSGATPGPPYVATKFNLYTATSDLWRTDHGFQSTVHLTNMLSVAPMDVTVTLYMADGTPYVLPVVHIGPSGTAAVNVNTALAAAPAGVASHLSQSGSATLQYRYDWAGAVLGSTLILDTVRSLQFASNFVFPEPVMPGGNAASAANTIEGIWWKYAGTSSVYVSVANATNATASADIAVFDQQMKPLGKHHVALAAHASSLTLLDDLIGASPGSSVGGVEITYAGGAEDLIFTGGIEDDAAGYSAKLRLGMTMMAGMAPAAGQAAGCTVASAGLMVGAPDPMMGFPAGVGFSLFGYARNTSSAPLTLSGLVNYMDASGAPHSVSLAGVSLAAGQASNMNLAKAVPLPFASGMVNLSFTYNAPCGSVLLTTGSVDGSGSYVFEVEPEVVSAGGGRISPYWQVGAGTDTMYSFWNPTAVAEDLMVTIYYDQQGDTYLAPLHLGPNASSGISIMELMEKAQPDAQGHVIPMNARAGVMQVRSPGSDLRNLVTVVVGGGIYNPVAGTCQNPCIVCPGATGAEILPSSFSIPAGTSESFQFFLIENNGSTENYSESATWEGSSSVLTVQPQLATGLEAGSAGISANMSAGVPEYSASFCAGTACPTGGQGASISGSVTPSVSGVSPSMAPAGGTQAVVISGAGFGTNPQVSISGGGSAVVNSSTNTTINATLTIPGGSSGGNQNLTVTAAGFSSFPFVFFIQIPTYFKMLGVTPVVGCTWPQVGLAVTAEYQVLDQASNAIQVAGMTPLENAPGTGGQFKSYATPLTTNSSGILYDTPVTTCFSGVNQTTCVSPQQTFELTVGATNFPITTVVNRRECADPLGQRITVSNPYWTFSQGTVN